MCDKESAGKTVGGVNISIKKSSRFSRMTFFMFENNYKLIRDQQQYYFLPTIAISNLMSSERTMSLVLSAT